MTQIARDPPTQHRFADDGEIPNSRLPLLLYHRPIGEPDDPAGAIENLFAQHGWSNCWRDGIYEFHHFHSTAHEVLGIARGRVRARFGGAQGRTLELETGDVVVIPAGVGHKNEGQSADLLVIGAYAQGRSWDVCTGRPGERPGVLDRIGQVPLPEADPVGGAGGALVPLWRDASI